MGLFTSSQKEEQAHHKVTDVAKNLDKYNRKIRQCSNSVELLDKSVQQLQEIIKESDSRKDQKKMDHMQFAMDIKYLKDQGDQFHEQLMEVTDVKLREIKRQIDSNKISIDECVGKIEELDDIHRDMMKQLLANQRFCMYGFIISFLTLLGVIVLLLVNMRIIVF